MSRCNRKGHHHGNKGNGFDLSTLILQASANCLKKCGCSMSQFRRCADTFEPSAAASGKAPGAFATWYATKEFPEVAARMGCFIPAAPVRSSDLAVQATA